MPVILTDPIAANKTVVLWDSWFSRPVTVVSASAQMTGFPAINITEEATYNSWRASGAPNYAGFDCGALRAVDALGIAAHTLGTSGAGVQLLGSNDDITYSTILSHSPLTNEELFFIFPLVSFRYYRVRVTLNGAQIGVVKAGRRLDFPCTPIMGYKPVHHSRKYNKYFNNSMEGHLLGNRVMSAGGTTTVEFPEIPRSFVDGPLRGFQDHYARGGTFFYAGWPGGKPQDVAYAWADGEDAMVDVSYTGGEKLSTVGFGMSMYYGR